MTGLFILGLTHLRFQAFTDHVHDSRRQSRIFDTSGQHQRSNQCRHHQQSLGIASSIRQCYFYLLEPCAKHCVGRRANT